MPTQQDEDQLAADAELAAAVALSLAGEPSADVKPAAMTGPPPDDAALKALLAEALDDFDEDDKPAPSAPAVRPQELAAAKASSEAAAMDASSAEDALAKMLMDGLKMDDPAMAEKIEANMAAVAKGAIDVSDDGPQDEEMERTLRALAASAEGLADDGKGGSADDEAAMMELLKTLGGAAAGAGDGTSADPANVEAGMLDLLQKLSAEMNTSLGPGMGSAAGSSGDGSSSGGTQATPARTQASGGGKAKASAAASGGASGGGANGEFDGLDGLSGLAGLGALGGLGGLGAVGAVGAGGGAPAKEGGEGDDAAMEGLLDNLVGQLLSKDVMHEPMRHLHAEFPKYMKTHSDNLSADEKARYLEQQRLVALILEAYDKTPEDTDKVATLMQKMQACGPPPPEIAGPVADGVGCCMM